MNVLVTGGSRGLGINIIQKILSASEDNKVYSISRTISEELQALEQEYHGRLFVKSIDLLETETLRKKIFSDFIGKQVPIHGFVNNAAMAYDDLITNLSIEELAKMFSVNVFSPFLLTKYVLRNMLLNKVQGSIVHISSISVHTGYKGLSMYAASKGALESFSKNTAREWGGIGIRSNAVVAGFMETAMSSSLSAEQKNRIYKRTSLKRPTETSDVADMVCFLLGEQSRSITGQSIHVDSGTI